MRKHEGLINSGAADPIDLTNATSKINLRLDDMHDLISRLRVAISADSNGCHPLNSPFSILPSPVPLFSSCHSAVRPHHSRMVHTLMKKPIRNSPANVDPEAPLKCCQCILWNNCVKRRWARWQLEKILSVLNLSSHTCTLLFHLSLGSTLNCTCLVSLLHIHVSLRPLKPYT